jgi:hypothetical protein
MVDGRATFHPLHYLLPHTRFENASFFFSFFVVKYDMRLRHSKPFQTAGMQYEGDPREPGYKLIPLG